jgi:hypothetical protein
MRDALAMASTQNPVSRSVEQPGAFVLRRPLGFLQRLLGTWVLLFLFLFLEAGLSLLYSPPGLGLTASHPEQGHLGDSCYMRF